MKKEILIIALTIFLIGFISAAVRNVDNTVACSDITGTPYCTIQAAIDAVTTVNGDTIAVLAGTYSPAISTRSECGNEPASICLYKNLILRGNPGNASAGPGPNAPVLNGTGLADGSAIALQRNGSLISNVTIEGFEIKNYANPGPFQGGVGSAIISWNTQTSNITIQDNYLHDLGWNGVLVGSDDGTTQSNWSVRRNIISEAAYAGVELTNVINSKVLNNTISVSNGNWDAGDSGVGIEVAVRDHGTGVTAGTNVLVEGNTLSGGSLGRASINLLSRAYQNPSNSLLKDITVQNNKISGAGRGIFVMSNSRNSGDSSVSGILIKNNTIDANNDGIVIQDFLQGGTTATHGSITIINNNIVNSLGPSSGIRIISGTSASGIEIHRNNIVGNLAYGLNHEGTGTLNATLNWWGDCSGPDVDGLGNPGTGDSIANATGGPVLFNPWIGVCITNKINVQCAEQSKNVVLSANVSSSTGTSFIDDVWFSYTINGINYNKTGVNTFGDVYNATINSSELIGGQSVSWNVYANDTSGFVVSNGLKTFYVRNATRLGIVPFPANGLNGWWVTEPTFSLTKDTPSAGNDSWYQWDADDILLYSGAFDLDNIPNQNPISAGTLELNWWTTFGSCGNETVQSQILHIDLTNPLITNLQPGDGATVFNNLRPTISALLDEIYGSNSGINQSNVSMRLDGNVVTPNVTSSGDLDAIVSFMPGSDLLLGDHQVYVNVTDNAGRFSQKTWNFTINTTAVFNMNISSPKNITYGTKKIPFNISLGGEAERIEYINYNERFPRWRILCRDCNQSGFDKQKNKTLLEGENLIGIKATDFLGQTNEKNISLFIDSKEPKILKTEPAKNKVTNGSFSIKYTEDNVKEVLLSWNPTVNLTSQCNTPGKNVVCDVQIVNLSNFSAYNGQNIMYWINMTDIANKTASTKPTKVFVDTTAPVINFFNHSISGKTVEFVILITEANFDEINYVDLSQSNPRKVQLCSEISGGLCNKKKTFKTGAHNLTINVLDDAGNIAQTNLNFTIV